MKKIILVFLIFLFTLKIIFAQSIEFKYPSKSIGENITFSLILIDFPKEIYDVKIDIFSTEERISKVWDGSWKSSNYYIKEAIYPNEKRDFYINISKYEGIGNIILKIRNKSGKIFVYDNLQIEIIKNITEELNEKSEEISKINATKETLYSNYFKEIRLSKEFDPIILNPKNIKTNKNFVQVLEEYKKYSIFGFCIILLIIYKSNKKKKNEFRR